MSAWNKTLYSFIAMTDLKMLWNQFLNFCFTQCIALFIAIFHQVLQYDFSGNIHSYCKMNLPLYFNCLKLLGLLDSEFLGDRAAEGVGVVLTVYEDVLNPSMHANIRMLYKQRFFTENSSRLTEGFQNASAGKFILQLTMLYPILWFWRFYQKRQVFEISSVWIVAQLWNACVWYWKMSKSIDKHINKWLLKW